MVVKIAETRCVITDIYILIVTCISLSGFFIFSVYPELFVVFIVIVFIVIFTKAIARIPDCILKLIQKTIILQFQKILYGISSCRILLAGLCIQSRNIHQLGLIQFSFC